MNKKTPKIRKFESGATRDRNDDKFDYHKFSNPLVEWSFASYMHKHRQLPDGSYRDGDNWQKGFDDDTLLGSAKRHFIDWELIEKGIEVIERGEKVELLEALNAIKFNVNARILNILKETKTINRNEK